MKIHYYVLQLHARKIGRRCDIEMVQTKKRARLSSENLTIIARITYLRQVGMLQRIHAQQKMGQNLRHIPGIVHFEPTLESSNKKSATVPL